MPISDTFRLDNKVAIITGASKGIGKAMAKGLGQQGAKIVISSRNKQALDETVKAFLLEGIDAIGITAHMGDLGQIKNLVEQTVEHFGGIDIIVNNAATNPSFGPIAETDSTVFNKIIDVNVRGPLDLAKLVYPIMKERGGGSIINISSIEGLTPGTGLGLYSVSKSALIALTKVLAKEWGQNQIQRSIDRQ
jgi:NAD(P)-dependent dehydrogenase (short-subunit alcohol dehydrogenase family)